LDGRTLVCEGASVPFRLFLMAGLLGLVGCFDSFAVEDALVADAGRDGGGDPPRRRSRARIGAMRPFRPMLALAVAGCAGGADRGSDPVEPSAGAETSAEPSAEPATADRLCAESPEAFAQALAETFEGYEPPADRAALEVPLDWSPSLRAWNDLQSEPFHIAEDADRGRLSGRYHAWGMAMPPARRELLLRGPVELLGESGELVVRAGPEGDPATLRMIVTREDGCLRVDEN